MSTTHVPTEIKHENETLTIYSIGNELDMGKDKQTKPFIHNLTIHTANKETIEIPALFDGGALVGAMDASRFEEIKYKLGTWKPSNKQLRMANGATIPSQATWEGTLSIEGIKVKGAFEVFDSQGGWTFLLGKPLLKKFRAMDDHYNDTVTIQSEDLTTITTLLNMSNGNTPAKHQPTEAKKVLTDITADVEDDKESTEATTQYEYQINQLNTISTGKKPNNTIFTRHTKPFNPARIERILKEVQIGEDVTPEQQEKVKQKLTEFADCFALGLSEVNAVPGVMHRLNIPEGAKMRTKISQRALNPAQKKFMDAKVDEMLEAGIIAPIHPRDVKNVASTVLAQKAHDGQGLTLQELQHRVNDQCVKHGLSAAFDIELPSRPEPHTYTHEEHEQKWRICQEFNELNKVTKVAPMPQGDIRAKQLRLSGHRYIHIFDFAAGFYAIPIHPDSQPYITFYVEGRGYMKYLRMPFGVTGGPSEFGHLTAQRLHDLTANGTVELFVDDGGVSSDSFEEGMTKLQTLLERVRREKLSLSPSKLKLFMMEATFAGATVGPQGVRPDLAKITAIVNWPTPEDASHLEGFLGLTGYFRDLIKGYASTEKPLRDILQKVDIPKGTGKHAYRRIMRAYKLKEVWSEEHDKAFINLKAKLVSEPVLRAPLFDGTHFILTTDGSMDAFAGVLSQKVKTTLPGGKEITRMHPIGYASKRTSTTEENYKPYLLEFAALKFSLDKFADTIWGMPVEIETDCQALRDVLLNDKLNATHARWRDSVLAYNIVDARHIPGTLNIADGISRQYEGTPKGGDDGSGWTVEPDLEKVTGMVHDIFHIEITPENEKLMERFKDEPIFLEVIKALTGNDQDTKNLKDRLRAKHRAQGYMIEEDKLWFIGGGTATRARARRECVTKLEAAALARKKHEEGGHFHRDGIKIALLDEICSPKLDKTIIKAITDCARCKNFGGANLHALLKPITRRHPFELLVGDYLSMPTGKGGFTTIGLYLDTFSQHIWGYKFKTKGSGGTTVKSLNDIFHNFAPPETFMTDGGTHFKCKEVTETCNRWGTKHHVAPAYSPWVNGLVEGTNKLLLYILARLCAPEVGEDGWQNTKWETLPRTWPDHFDEAIKTLNWRILPALKFSPKELLLGLVVNTAKSPLEASTSLIPPSAIDTHILYVEQQRLDGYTEAVRHAIRRKATFDRKVLKSRAGPVEFAKGDLIQVYRNDLANTLSTEKKLAPMWSKPQRIKERIENSYRLETLEGKELEGEFSARRLQKFSPREGTELAAAQKQFMEEQETEEDIKDGEVEEEEEKAEEEGRSLEEETQDTYGDEDAAGSLKGAHGVGQGDNPEESHEQYPLSQPIVSTQRASK